MTPSASQKHPQSCIGPAWKRSILRPLPRPTADFYFPGSRSRVNLDPLAQKRDTMTEPMPVKPPPGTQPASRLAHLLGHPVFLSLLLAAAALAVYYPVVGHGFVSFDDPDYVTANPHVKAGLTGGDVAWAFRTSHAGNWHPLTWISHALDVQLYGLNPAGHHLTNLLFHAANSVLLFLLLRQATSGGWRVTKREAELVTPPPPPPRDTRHPTRDTLCWPCFFVAALFALHPLHVESVAWVAERKDVLSGFFFLLTLWAYARYANDECRMTNDEFRMRGSSTLNPQPGARFTFHVSRFTLLPSRPPLLRPGPDEQADAGDRAVRAPPP